MSNNGQGAARFVWSEGNSNDRNAFTLFRQRIKLDREPSAATLNIYADSRYRLFVNQQRVGYGPVIGIPPFPEYDSYDLRRWLEPGENEILVEANIRNARTFQ